MTSFSIVHWAIMALIAVLIVVPVYRLLRESDRSPALALLALFAPLGLIMLGWLMWDARQHHEAGLDLPDRPADFGT